MKEATKNCKVEKERKRLSWPCTSVCRNERVSSVPSVILKPHKMKRRRKDALLMWLPFIMGLLLVNAIEANFEVIYEEVQATFVTVKRDTITQKVGNYSQKAI